MSSYELIREYDFSKEKTYIGEKDYCVFCHKHSPEVTFKEKTHAIPEFFGNKSIFTLNECDDCNQKFSHCEESVANLFHLYRSLRSIKGKKGVVKLARGVIIDNDETKKEWRLHSKPDPKKRQDIKLEPNKKKKCISISLKITYIPSDIKIAFSKMVFSLIQDSVNEFEVYNLENILSKDNYLYSLVRSDRIKNPKARLFKLQASIGRFEKISLPKFLLQIEWENYILSYFYLLDNEKALDENSYKLMAIQIPRYLYSANEKNSTVLPLNSNDKIEKIQTEVLHGDFTQCKIT